MPPQLPMGGGSSIPGIGPGLGSAALDFPPPSPTPMGGAPPGGDFSLRGLAGTLPSTRMPPQVLTGLMQAAQSVSDLLDAFAQVTPDQQAHLGLMKDLLQQYLATVMQAGAGPVSPTASGPAFPGGGIDQGLAGPGSVY